MIQHQGTGGTPPDTTADEVSGRRAGTYPYYPVEVAAPGENRHYLPQQAETEVAS